MTKASSEALLRQLRGGRLLALYGEENIGQVAELAERMGNYRLTPDGFEPVQDWTTTPVIPDGKFLQQEFVFWLIQETIDLGCPPKGAVRTWGMVLDAVRKRRKAGDMRPFNPDLYLEFLKENYSWLLDS